MRILLENWFTYVRLDWATPTPVTVIGGVEGVGKSALRDGIEFVLLGTCRGVPTKKALGRIAIREGADSARVAVQIPGRIQVVRTLAPSGSQDLVVVDLREGGARYEGKITDVEPKLFEILGVEPQQVRAALNAWTFLELLDADRRELLLATDSAAASREQLVEAFEKLEVNGDEVERALSWIATSGFREAEKKAAAERAAAKRELQGLEKPEPKATFLHRGDPPTAAVDLSKRTLAAFEDDLKLKRSAHEGVAKASGQTAGEVQSEIRSLERQLTQKREALEGLDASRSLDDINAELATAREELEAREGEVAQAEEDLAAVQAEIGGLPATVDPEVLGSIEGVSKTSLKAVRAHGEQSSARAGELADQLQRAQSKVSDRIFHRDRASEAVDALEEEASGAETYHDRASGLRGEIAGLEEDLRNQRAALTDADRNTKNDPLEFARTQVERAEARLNAKRAYDRAVAALATYEQDAQAAREKIDRWDAVATALKPSGVESILLRAKLEQIRAHLAHMATLGAATIDDDLVLGLMVDDVDRVYAKLSRAQRMRLGIAFQHAIAVMAGFPLLIVDEFDTLDGPHRRAGLQALLHVAPCYDAVLALTTILQPMTRPDVEGLSAFEIHDGQLVEAGS